jgi:oligoendopeptidase F
MPEAIYTQSRWRLDDLIAERAGPAMEAVLSRLENLALQIEATRDALEPTISESAFGEVLKLMEEVGYVERLLNGYATLWLSEDTSNQDALAFRGRVDKATADASNRRLFFELWWKRLDAENAARLLETSGDLRYYLETLRRFAPFTLSEPEEKIINLKDVHGVGGMTTLYDMITNDLVFEIVMDGETRRLTRTELMVYARDPQPERRAAAYRALYEVFGEHGNILGQIYKYIVGDWHEENLKLRGVPTAIAARNLQNDVPDDVVDLLLETSRKNATVFQRYFRLKKGWLGLDKLRRCDIYAPIEDVSREIAFPDGVRLALESMRGFSKTVADLAEQVLADGHLDSEVRAGKDTGAFCYGVVPDKTPWVLTNYNGRYDDAATLAHELGHAVHAMLASDHSVLTFRSSLPLAETASNFAQILLLKRLLSSETDPRVRRSLLAGFVDDSYASILRQASFVLFEREAHRMISEAGTTVDELSARYLETLREQFGDDVEISDDFRWEWVSIPHIYHVPFYCYAYAFGLLLVLALYRQYEQEGEAFVPKYLRILRYGGSKAPVEILDEAGFDVRTEAFWQGGFDVIAEMIDELEGSEVV